MHLTQAKTAVDEQVRKNRSLAAEADAHEDSLSRDVSSKGVPGSDVRQKQQPSGNPLLFDFEHYYDPELTPRKKWQQRNAILDAQLAEEKQKLER